MRVCRGVTREVLLVGRWAVKVPSIRSWRLFLTGLLANLHEDLWSATRDRRLCPVRWCSPGGFVLVMARAEALAESDFVVDADFAGLPLDAKPENFGRYGGRVVLLDYG
jgi:hypothetical protein